eukprot:15241886-Alexandrium_andersonii.AAC.1
MRWPAAGKRNRADRNRPACPRTDFGLSDFLARARGGESQTRCNSAEAAVAAGLRRSKPHT